MTDMQEAVLQLAGERKATVSIAVDGRVDVEIVITPGMTKEQMADAAREVFRDADLSNMEVVGGEPVNLYSEDGLLEFDF